MTQELPADELTVSDVAERFHITVRTLHHYDDIGLLTPRRDIVNGYRYYCAADLERLSRIVVYRRLELPLDEIALLLDEGDDISHLIRQRERVMSRLDELTDLAAAIDKAMEKTMTTRPLTDDDRRELFGENFDDHQAQAEMTWDGTPRWTESRRRTASYTRTDWLQITSERDDTEQAFADAYRAGAAADSEQAMNVAEQHRRHVDHWFYDCPAGFHRLLGDMFMNDPAHRARYDEAFGLPGLASFVRDSIHANADLRDR